MRIDDTMERDWKNAKEKHLSNLRETRAKYIKLSKIFLVLLCFTVVTFSVLLLPFMGLPVVVNIIGGFGVMFVLFSYRYFAQRVVQTDRMIELVENETFDDYLEVARKRIEKSLEQDRLLEEVQQKIKECDKKMEKKL